MFNKGKDLEQQFSEVASLIGDRSRALILWSLLDGKAYTATELSISAGLSSQGASNHLARLVNAGLLSVDKQGRHRYYRYANDSVAKVIESMASLFPPSSHQVKETTNSSGITFARTCYDHIAGRLGVQLTRALLQNKILREKDQQYHLTSLSKEWFGNLGISVDAIREQRRSFAYPCLDWSERKHHLAGALGAAMLKKLVETDWIRKMSGSRQLILTAKGEKGLSESLKLSF